MGNAILFLRRSLGTVCGLAFEQSLQDGGCAAEGVLKPDGVGIVVGGVRAEAADFGGDGMAAEDAKTEGAVMHPQLEGNGAVGPPAQSAGNAGLGCPDHFLREKSGRAAPCAEAGLRLPVVEAQDAFRRKLELQSGRAVLSAAAGTGKEDAIIRPVLFDAQKAGLRFHRGLLSPKAPGVLICFIIQNFAHIVNRLTRFSGCAAAENVL